ncbi:hypothetical protein ABZT49_00660 [Methylobacterium sp. EM32]|uniref:hypothetical protein n=1 Tax=Methylobacterium sp. EM32 TaxID=3163481 RepID=UPI0033A5D69A
MAKRSSRSCVWFALTIAAVPIGGDLLSPPAQATSPSTQRVTFACPGDLTLVVEFAMGEPRAPALVRPSAGPAVTLPSLQSGDGFRYSDAGHELRGRGREVTWSERSKPAVTCKTAQANP